VTLQLGVLELVDVVLLQLVCATPSKFVIYYEEIKREVKSVKRILICAGKKKSEGSTLLSYTGLCGGLEHLKIETRLRVERFENVKGEYVI